MRGPPVDHSRLDAVLRFIAGYHAAHGYGPSYEEIAVGTGRSPASKGPVSRDVQLLKDARAIRNLSNRHRSIEVIAPIAIPRAPDGAPLYFVRVG